MLFSNFERAFILTIVTDKIAQENGFSSPHRCSSFLVIYMRMNYTCVGIMLRIILPFLLSCNNELFSLNTAYGKDFMAILTI